MKIPEGVVLDQDLKVKLVKYSFILSGWTTSSFCRIFPDIRSIYEYVALEPDRYLSSNRYYWGWNHPESIHYLIDTCLNTLASLDEASVLWEGRGKVSFKDGERFDTDATILRVGFTTKLNWLVVTLMDSKGRIFWGPISRSMLDSISYTTKLVGTKVSLRMTVFNSYGIKASIPNIARSVCDGRFEKVRKLNLRK